MKASRMLSAVAVAMTLVGCDSALGVDLTGLWVASSYTYQSSTGETVDLISRDGASYSLTVDRFLDGRRRVTTSFTDGMGGSSTMSGEVFVDEGTFVFDTVTFRFTREGNVLTLEDPSATFDFGSGPEAATLTIRLTQL